MMKKIKKYLFIFKMLYGNYYNILKNFDVNLYNILLSTVLKQYVHTFYWNWSNDNFFNLWKINGNEAKLS